MKVPIDGTFQSKRPGICTIHAASHDWMVCPNRLFALDSLDPPDLLDFDELSGAVQYVLTSLGATPEIAGLPIGVWREIAIADKQDNKVFDYRFDFILNPVVEMTARQFADDWSVDYGNVRRIYRRHKTLFTAKRAPRFPLIVEVMTASTSGSSEEKGTGMKQAFYSAWDTVMNGAEIKQDAPGVNLRQVWGRMASQLIAKSEAGEQWGGRTVWIMQDNLLRYIHNTTGLGRSKDAAGVPLPLPLRSANIVSYQFDEPAATSEIRAISLDRYIGENIPDVLDAMGEPTMHGILHAPFVPSAGVMALKLLEAQQKAKSSLKVIVLP